MPLSRRSSGYPRMSRARSIASTALLLLLAQGRASAQQAAPEPAPDLAPAPASSGQAPAPAVQPPAARLPLETTYKWGGYIKLDGAYSTSSRGRTSDVADYVLIPGAIAVPDPGNNGNFSISGRESRFWFQTSTPTGGHGPVVTHIEIDFVGFDAGLGNEITSNPSSPRLRHAYGTWRGLLAGQFWSTWMDLDALPEKNDFGSPAGRVFARQGQVRFTRKLPSLGGELQLAVENPESTLTVQAPGDAAQGTQLVPTDDLMPDTVAKVVTRGAWGHLAAAGIARLIRSDGALAAAATTSDSKLGFGGQLSGKVMLGERNNLRFTATYGRGIGRYIAFGGYRDGEIDAQGDISLVNVAAGILSGQVWLTDTVRVNLVGSASQSSGNADALADSVNKRLVTVHSNVMWSAAETVRLALEHVFVQRVLESDVSGTMHRIQASARYTF